MNSERNRRRGRGRRSEEDEIRTQVRQRNRDEQRAAEDAEVEAEMSRRHEARREQQRRLINAIFAVVSNSYVQTVIGLIISVYALFNLIAIDPANVIILTLGVLLLGLGSARIFRKVKEDRLRE